MIGGGGDRLFGGKPWGKAIEGCEPSKGWGSHPICENSCHSWFNLKAWALRVGDEDFLTTNGTNGEGTGWVMEKKGWGRMALL